MQFVPSTTKNLAEQPDFMAFLTDFPTSASGIASSLSLVPGLRQTSGRSCHIALAGADRLCRK
jgi:hypothetical protein